MKKREEEMMQQNEDRMMKQLKENLKAEKIPESIAPASIKEKLAQEAARESAGGKRPFYRRRGWAAALCALALAAVCFGVYGVNRITHAPKKSQTSDMTAGSGAQEPDSLQAQAPEKETQQPRETEAVYTAQKIANAGSYDNLFALFKEQEVATPEYSLSPVGIDKSYDMGGEMSGAASGGTSGGSVPESVDDSAISGGAPQETVADMENAGAPAGEGSVSTTNVQEQGVDEADIIKTDGTFIYILQENENALRVVRADNGRMTECDNHLLDGSNGSISVTPLEMYVSDGLLTVLLQYRENRYFDKNYEPISEEEAKELLDRQQDAVSGASITNDIVSVDLNEPLCYSDSRDYVTAETFSVGEDGVLTSVGKLTQDGNYSSSRKAGGIVYLFTTFYTSIIHADGSVAEEYVPRVNGACIPADSIALPDAEARNSYIVCSSFACDEPGTVINQFSVLDANFYAEVYVSKNALYFAEACWEPETEEDYTQILKYAYQDGVMTPYGACRIKGRVHNSFSMDEYNGCLRVVTTENRESLQYVQYERDEYGGLRETKRSDEWFEGCETVNEWKLYNHLFVLNEEMVQVGSIENIAEDEDIQSSRFMGDTGYFVTYRNTDPLFSVDLSDPANPRIVGELKIPGFSRYLHFYDAGLLLGLGEETDEESGSFVSLKLSMFDISDPYNVKETDKFLISEVMENAWSCDALFDHKALLIQPDRNIIGFAAAGESNWDEATETATYDNNYMIFGYGENGFYEQFSFEQDCNAMRGLFIGDVLYVCGWTADEGETLTSFDMADGYAQIGQLTLPKTYTPPEYEVEYGLAVD